MVVPRRLAPALPSRESARLRRLEPIPLALLLALAPAGVAEEPVGVEVDAAEAARAPPPAPEDGPRGARRPPLAVGLGAAPQQVLLVVDAQVVAEVVVPEERAGVPLALLVVAQVLGLVLRVDVHALVVPVQVRLPAGVLAAPRERALEASFVL